MASTLWTYRIQALEIVVSRNETDACPDVVVNADGTRDLTGQGAYLRSKRPAYQKAARETANRILSFFQYSLFTPLVRPVSPWNQSLHSPTWLDASGKELRGDYVVIAEPVPGVNGELGVRKLTQEILPELQNFLATPAEPSLALALLSDAQTAWFEGGLRRSVLELAICTEVMVKRRFFAKDTAAGAAFDYMEDKAKVSIRVLDLIDAVAEEAFGASYKKQESSWFQKIDYLFRCRNKIAHRGELSFRDDLGRKVSVDAPQIAEWWCAVANLKDWLESCNPAIT